MLSHVIISTHHCCESLSKKWTKKNNLCNLYNVRHESELAKREILLIGWLNEVTIRIQWRRWKFVDSNFFYMKKIVDEKKVQRFLYNLNNFFYWYLWFTIHTKLWLFENYRYLIVFHKLKYSETLFLCFWKEWLLTKKT